MVSVCPFKHMVGWQRRQILGTLSILFSKSLLQGFTAQVGLRKKACKMAFFLRWGSFTSESDVTLYGTFCEC